MEILLPLGLSLTFLFVLLTRGIVAFPEAEAAHFWMLSEHTNDYAPRVPLAFLAITAFVMSAFPFIALGHALAREMDLHPRLVGYKWDIAGSIIGIILFSLGSFAKFPAWAWLPLLGAVWAIIFAPRRGMQCTTVLAGLLFCLLATSSYKSQWSPYYLVRHMEDPIGLRVFVNSSFHQLAVDFDGKHEQSAQARAELFKRFSIPYERYRESHNLQPPKRVLILGAGTGNDVYVALKNGAKEITAVEIDPVIFDLGKTLNRSQPYADPRVTVHLTDARNFLQRTAYGGEPQKYDLIVFGTLDSQTLLSGVANLRLENYVYTVEALHSARASLSPDGLIALYYSVFREWLYGRIEATVREVFPHTEILKFDENRLFNAIVMSDLAGNTVRSAASAKNESDPKYLPSTDDWPFLYLERPGMSGTYASVFGAVSILVGTVFVLVRRLGVSTPILWDFFFLGVGFTLLESAAVVRLALLFGSTWLVNAVVFSSVLLTIFLGNQVALKGYAPGLRICYGLLLLSVLGNYWFPFDLLLGMPTAARISICGIFIGTPVFFASLCFSKLFGRQSSTGYALGLNLVGAMAGGLLEYLSMMVGLRKVWLIILLVYGLASAGSAARRS